MPKWGAANQIGTRIFSNSWEKEVYMSPTINPDQKPGSQVHLDLGSSSPEQAVTELLLRILAAGMKVDARESSRTKQVTDFMTAADIQDSQVLDMGQSTLSESYRFGQHTIARFPAYTAHRDNRSLLNQKAENLTKIGVKASVVNRFTEISNPEWGFTFRGVGIDDSGVHYNLDRTQTYDPFRQQLKLDVDTKGVIKWQYKFQLFDSSSLYFWEPNDTMGVTTPEFKHGDFGWCPVTVSGTVDRLGKLQFEDLEFYWATPNHRVKTLKRNRIVIEQKRVGGINGLDPHTDYVIKPTTMQNLFRFIRQPDYNIDTNPLLPFEVKKNRMSEKSI